MTLRVGVTLAGAGAEDVRFAGEAERLGADSVWVPEYWAGDALTPLAYLAARTSSIRLGSAIVQLGARTPAMLAMSALSLQALSGGRFVLGIGTSGPQVMEGWHGVTFTRPVRRTRETIEIIRTICSGERLRHDGEVYTLPLPGGEGRAIRSPLAPAAVPVYVASLGPANLRLTGELADGWIGTSFLPETARVFLGPIAEGAASAGRTLADLDLTVSVTAEFTPDEAAAEAAGRRHAAGYAFTIGAMGSAAHNFYNDAFARQGFAADVREVQRLWLAGEREAAAARVPAELGLHTNLIGTDAQVTDRLRRYRDAGIGTLRVSFTRPAGRSADRPADRVADLDRLLGLVADVNAADANPRAPG